jgi:hypothetical protein
VSFDYRCFVHCSYLPWYDGGNGTIVSASASVFGNGWLRSFWQWVPTVQDVRSACSLAQDPLDCESSGSGRGGCFVGQLNHYQHYQANRDASIDGSSNPLCSTLDPEDFIYSLRIDLEVLRHPSSHCYTEPRRVTCPGVSGDADGAAGAASISGAGAEWMIEDTRFTSPFLIELPTTTTVTEKATVAAASKTGHSNNEKQSWW